MYIHDIFSDIFNFLFKKRRDKIFIHCTKTCACVFNACINAKFVTQLRTQVQWFIFYAITQS